MIKHQATRVEAAAEALREPLERFFGVSLAPLALRTWALVALQAADEWQPNDEKLSPD
jgi:hypothetical protein